MMGLIKYIEEIPGLPLCCPLYEDTTVRRPSESEEEVCHPPQNLLGP